MPLLRTELRLCVLPKWTSDPRFTIQQGHAVIITYVSIDQEDIFLDVYASNLSFKNMGGAWSEGRKQNYKDRPIHDYCWKVPFVSEDRKSIWVFQPV